MATPLDAVMAIHNAFRHDMATIDAAALAVGRGEAGQAARLERFRFFNEVLVWHAHGEELAIFPALKRWRRWWPRPTSPTTTAWTRATRR